MPKNKGKGGKNRRRGKNENDNEKRELTFKEDGQEYAQVVKMLGYVFHMDSVVFFVSCLPLCLLTLSVTCGGGLPLYLLTLPTTSKSCHRIADGQQTKHHNTKRKETG